MNSVIVSGGFDDLRSREVRFLQEAASRGPVEVLLWSDDVIRAQTGTSPKFPLEERQYFVGALRFVQQVTRMDQLEGPNHLPQSAHHLAGTWVVPSEADHPAKRAFCQGMGSPIAPWQRKTCRGFRTPLQPGTTPLTAEKSAGHRLL